MSSILKVKGIEKLNASDLAALVETAESLNMDPDWLAAVISFETAGTFSPQIVNAAGSGAFGLIQFMPTTAKNILKTSTSHEAVTIGKSMDFREQLEKMVVPYFKGRTYRSLHDVYLAVFYPVAMNKSEQYVIGTQPSAVYTQNAGFDREGKGYITRGDVVRTIQRVYDAANGVRIPVPIGAGAMHSKPSQVFIGVLAALVSLIVANKYLPRKYLPQAFSFKRQIGKYI